MKKSNVSRRDMLARGATLPLAGLAFFGAARAASAAEAVCADPNQLDAGQVSIRESLNYVEKSPDPAKICGGCGFLTDVQAGCGNCMIFNGPANVNGHCDSWGAKEG